MIDINILVIQFVVNICIQKLNIFDESCFIIQKQFYVSGIITNNCVHDYSNIQNILMLLDSPAKY